MKHKYTISKDEENNCLVIQEFAELDKDMLTFVCESTCEDRRIRASISKGTDAVVAALRTPNFYPSVEYAKKIAEVVTDFYQRKATEPTEIIFDDAELIPKEKVKVKIIENDDESDDNDLEDMIEDDYEDYSDKEALKKVNASIKVADDEYDDFGDDD